MNWEDRFSISPGPVRVILQSPATVSRSPFEPGHLSAGGALFAHTATASGKRAYAPRPGKSAGPVPECSRREGHQWLAKGVDKYGTRLVRCPHCKHSTTARNAGVNLAAPVRYKQQTVVPLGGEPACSHAAGHRWIRNGTTKNGVRRISCGRCGARSRQAAATT